MSRSLRLLAMPTDYANGLANFSELSRTRSNDRDSTGSRGSTLAVLHETRRGPRKHVTATPMTSGRRKRGARQKAGTESGSGSTYEIGYGKPPKQHRFRPGRSGNPAGRPKGAKNSATLTREILDRKIEVRSGAGVRKISRREAILTRFAESALEGDTKSAAFLLGYDMPESAEEQANNGATPEEQEIIDAYLKARFKDTGEKK
jgi:hypothetical protein